MDRKIKKEDFPDYSAIKKEDFPDCSAKSTSALPIACIKAERNYSNLKRVRGRVVFLTGIEEWRCYSKSGIRFHFDISDKTGSIRVNAWNAAAEFAGSIIERGKSVELNNVLISFRNKRYNNLDHEFELLIPEHTFCNCTLREISQNIDVLEEKCSFTELSKVKNMPKFSYFSIFGKITAISEPFSGQGPKLNDYEGHYLDVEDKNGTVVKVAVFNKYFPVTEDIKGKIITIFRCKYSHTHNSICVTGAYVLLDGVRVI